MACFCCILKQNYSHRNFLFEDENKFPWIYRQKNEAKNPLPRGKDKGFWLRAIALG
jgi:hypothetical protein